MFTFSQVNGNRKQLIEIISHNIDQQGVRHVLVGLPNESSVTVSKRNTHSYIFIREHSAGVGVKSRLYVENGRC